MPDDYGYINARIRAMRSFLLKKEDYLNGLGAKTAEEFFLFLRSIPSYGDDASRFLATHPVRFACELALKSNLHRIFRKIIRFCDGEPKRLLLIALRHWDVYNLKTIIRAVLSRKEKDEISQALIPVGKWDLEFLNLLARHTDLKALAKTLAASSEDEVLGLEREFARLIMDSLDAPSGLLENSLEETFFSKAQDYLASKQDKNFNIMLNYMALQVDFHNILLVLKKTSFPAAGGQFRYRFIRGGRITDGFLKKLNMAKSIEEVLKSFERTPYRWLSQEGVDVYKRTKRISSIERLVAKQLFFFSSDLYTRGDPLSAAIPLAFINFKENEIINLRLLCFAKLYNMPNDLVMEDLIFAQ